MDNYLENMSRNISMEGEFDSHDHGSEFNQVLVKVDFSLPISCQVVYLGRTLYLNYFSLHITVTLPDYIPEETSIYVISSYGSLNPPCLSLLSDTCDMYLICASTSLHAGHRATEESPPRPLQRRSAPARLTGTCAPHCTQYTVYTLYTSYCTVYRVYTIHFIRHCIQRMLTEHGVQ